MPSQARDTRALETRDKLVSTARGLFAERGVEGVSLREITRAAGQANVSALQYHFGDRATLLAAVLEAHHRKVDRLRHAQLDDIEADAAVELRELGAALVRPPASMLQVEGGGEYLRILGEVIRQPKRYGDKLIGFGSSLGRWHRLVVPRTPAEVAPLHRRLTAIQLTFGELAHRAERARRGQHDLFVSNLIDLATGVLATPVSAETAGLLAGRSS